MNIISELRKFRLVASKNRNIVWERPHQHATVLNRNRIWRRTEMSLAVSVFYSGFAMFGNGSLHGSVISQSSLQLQVIITGRGGESIGNWGVGIEWFYGSSRQFAADRKFLDYIFIFARYGERTNRTPALLKIRNTFWFLSFKLTLLNNRRRNEPNITCLDISKSSVLVTKRKNMSLNKVGFGCCSQ